MLIGRMPNAASQVKPSDTPHMERTEILVSDGMLTDATLQARHLLECGPAEQLTWSEIATALRPFFGPLPEVQPTEAAVLPAIGDPETLMTLAPDGNRLRLTFTGPPAGIGECLRLRADLRELSQLRHVMARTPTPVWQTDSTRRVVWGNTSFDDLCTGAGLADRTTPPFDILPDDREDIHVSRVSSGAREDGTQSWYEVRSYRVPEGRLNFAQNIDAVIHAEATQRNFLQTLTRIFAHLPIALAVFDKDLRLVLFNPALLDLTKLPAEFLSGRPNLLSFFDMLREKRMMPEPKNYRSWRDKLSEVIAAASSDLYVETWNLPSGLTYKITGRPHPDGGVAFLFEDISAEISLTRRFRQEIEVTQAVLDCLDDAVAVFSQLGVLSFCNDPYRQLWGSDPDSSIAEIGIAEATRDWQANCRPSPIWGELRDFTLTLGDRAGWDAELQTLDGQRLLCRAEPLSGGATLIRFSPCLCPAKIPAEVQGADA
ncbi:PAS-domain containing protein [Pelagibaca abyssi]|nr:PAS-domain containing protein [Salipiger abyssi]